MKQLWARIKNIWATWRHRKNSAMQKMWLRKGSALDKEGNTQAALACFDTALQLDVRDPLAWHFKGGALLKLGKYRAAKAAYQKFIALAPIKYANYVTETKVILRNIDDILKKTKNSKA